VPTPVFLAPGLSPTNVSIGRLTYKKPATWRSVCQHRVSSSRPVPKHVPIGRSTQAKRGTRRSACQHHVSCSRPVPNTSPTALLNSCSTTLPNAFCPTDPLQQVLPNSFSPAASPKQILPRSFSQTDSLHK
jgi:hypothetical protein